MRRILMVLILAVCGCSDGGIGIAGFGAPDPILNPGIYTGDVECLFIASLQSGVTSSFSSDELSISIRDTGLPDFAGSDPKIGVSSEFDLGFLAGISTVASFSTDTGKVLIGTSIQAVGFFDNQATAIVAGVGSVLYEQRLDGGIDYSLSLLLGSSDAVETLSWDCAGVVRR